MSSSPAATASSPAATASSPAATASSPASAAAVASESGFPPAVRSAESVSKVLEEQIRSGIEKRVSEGNNFLIVLDKVPDNVRDKLAAAGYGVTIGNRVTVIEW